MGNRQRLALTAPEFLPRSPQTNILVGWLQTTTEHDLISSLGGTFKEISAGIRHYWGKFCFVGTAPETTTYKLVMANPHTQPA